MDVLVIGAGGHGQVVADILLAMRAAGDADVNPVGFLDGNPNLQGRVFLGLPVLGQDQDLNAVPHDAVIVAIGDNARRRRLYEHLLRAGEVFANAVHPSAVLAPGVILEPGCMVCARAVVNTGAVILADTILNTGCVVEHHNRVGPHAHVAPGAVLGGECVVGEDALVGIGATILPRVRLGDGCVVGAGAVAVRDVAPGTTVVGVPARPR